MHACPKKPSLDQRWVKISYFLILDPDQFCNPHADLFMVYLVFNISYFKYRHPYFLSLLGALEGMEGFLPATTLPFSNLSNSPLHRVQGRLVAGWLQEKPLLLLLVNHKQYIYILELFHI